METIRKVRKAHFVDGKGIRHVVRELKLARNTVRDIIRSAKTDQKYERSKQPRPKLGLFADRLSELPRIVRSRLRIAAAHRSCSSNCNEKVRGRL